MNQFNAVLVIWNSKTKIKLLKDFLGESVLIQGALFISGLFVNLTFKELFLIFCFHYSLFLNPIGNGILTQLITECIDIADMECS